jgi:hypothetical protein
VHVYHRPINLGKGPRCGWDSRLPTARCVRAGRRIVEVPISYNPRRVDEGKKMRWIDGVDAIYALLKCRLTQSAKG